LGENFKFLASELSIGSTRALEANSSRSAWRILNARLERVQEALPHSLNPSLPFPLSLSLPPFPPISDHTKFETFSTATYIIANSPKSFRPSSAQTVAKFPPNFIKIPISAYTQLQGARQLPRPPDKRGGAGRKQIQIENTKYEIQIQNTEPQNTAPSTLKTFPRKLPKIFGWKEFLTNRNRKWEWKWFGGKANGKPFCCALLKTLEAAF